MQTLAGCGRRHHRREYRSGLQRLAPGAGPDVGHRHAGIPDPEPGGESPWQSVHPSNVDVETAWNDESIRAVIPMFEDLSQIPTVLVIAVDLEVIASMDKNLDRVGIISGGSIYPMAWNILLGARNEGFGGTLTTLLAANEPKAQELLGLEPNVAVAALLTIGKPKKQLTKLTRKKVEDFTPVDRADGPAFTG